MKKMNKKLCLFFSLLIAIFTLTSCNKKYQVSFVVDGKTQEVVEVKKGKQVSAIANPNKEDYTFIGWYNGDTQFDFNTPIKQDYTLYAKFEQTKFTVVFVCDDYIEEGVQVQKGECVSPIVSPIKTNYTFVGWYNGDTLFDFNTPIDQNYILTAKFEKSSFQVQFVVDDTIVQTVPVNINETITTISNPNKEDYTFIGWYNGDTLFDFNTPIDQDYTLTAKFEKSSFQVQFVVDDTIVQTIKANRNETITKITNPKKEGYTFVGWYVGDTLFDFNTPIDQDYTLTALFKVSVLSVEILGEKTELTVGETLQLSAIVTPSNALQDVVWSIRNTNGAISTIDENGLLTVLHPGKVYVYAASADVEYILDYVEITILHELLDEDIYDAFNIMTGLGSNAATDIEINYHTHNLKTVVEYTLATDTTFTNLSSIEPQYGYYFTNGTEAVPIQFDPRNVMRVSLTDLEPDTEYIYRINKGNNTYSDVYRFRTAKNDGSKTSFLALSDVHYWAVLDEETGEYTSHGSEISETIIQNALSINPNIGFIATAGDMVDQGGSVPTWEQFFKCSNSLTFLPRVSVAGNHEYYYQSTGQTDYKYQKAHVATPYNGPSTHVGVSGYTLYNDVLFIVFDNEKSVGRDTQLEWLEHVLETVEAKYTIIMMHTPIYYPAVGQNATDRDEELMGILEKYCVDLAISGHYHGNNWNPDYYEGATSTDSGLGVNYITLSFGGVKSMSDSNRPTGYIFDIENGIINITRINDYGDVVNTYTITTKKHKDIVQETKENLLNSIQEWTYDETRNRAIISFSDKFYGNVEKVVVTETLRGGINETFYFPTPSYKRVFIEDIKPNYDYHFVLTITFADGTTKSVSKIFKHGPDIQFSIVDLNASSVTLHFVGDDSLTYVVENYTIYINGVEYKTIPYTIDGEFVTSYTIENLIPNTQYRIEFVAKDRRSTIIYIDQIEVNTLEE